MKLAASELGRTVSGCTAPGNNLRHILHTWEELSLRYDTVWRWVRHRWKAVAIISQNQKSKTSCLIKVWYPVINPPAGWHHVHEEQNRMTLYTDTLKYFVIQLICTNCVKYAKLSDNTMYKHNNLGPIHIHLGINQISWNLSWGFFLYLPMPFFLFSCPLLLPPSKAYWEHCMEIHLGLWVQAGNFVWISFEGWKLLNYVRNWRGAGEKSVGGWWDGA